MSKNKVILIVAILAIALGLSLYVNYKQHQSITDLSTSVKNLGERTVNGNAKIIQTYVAPDSTNHAVTNEVAVKSDSEKKIAVGAPYTDTVIQALKVALSKIDELTKVNAQLTASIRLTSLPQTIADTGLNATPVLKTYSDKYLSLVYHPENDSVDLNYNVTLNQAKYWKRSWFLAQKQYYLDFWSDDQRVNINGVKRFTTNLPTSTKRFGLGVNAGYNYVPALNKWYPSAGVSINYNLVEF